MKIDFETLAQHILLLDKAARNNNLRIKKVILNTNLKDELFATPSGKILQSKNIYFARNLNNLLNKFHDDHYHVDFEILKKFNQTFCQIIMFKCLSHLAHYKNIGNTGCFSSNRPQVGEMTHNAESAFFKTMLNASY